ncbi:LPS-assembly protein LptD [Granulicella aggregans]|uniref:LPS-assembly protein LptD n=1 Tax=Granulicella aggregans TaxID=474949 RepID=UPI0021E06F93|nr:LPS assembly protein LptD [Granulicella aggregans]
MDFSKRSLRGYALFISITLFAVNSELLMGQQLASSLPPGAGVDALVAPGTSSSQIPAGPTHPDTTATNGTQDIGAQDGDGSLPFPAAVVVQGKDRGTPVKIESTNPQTRVGSLYTLDKDVVITYGDRIIQADHVEYDSDTGDVTATGHLVVSGGPKHEEIHASHGTFNTQTETGTFYDVTGSIGLRLAPGRPRVNTVVSGLAAANPTRAVYDNGNPFLFTGRIVVKKGPDEYDVIDGSVTSCQLPKPDWLLTGGLFSLDGDTAKAKNTIFHLLNVPLLYLPYVTHPVDPNHRQSGLLIPSVGLFSSTKGNSVGEQVYFALNRSMDLTLGSVYYSLRGFSESGSFRYRGLRQNFVTGRFSALQDRGYTPTGGVYTNQGGEDFVVKARYDLAPAQGETPNARLVADVEYLSSYVYREAFTENFNQAVSTDILSTLYGVKNFDGYSASLRADRYEGLKPLAQTQAQVAAGDPVQNSQLTIFHIPELMFTSVDHRLGATPFLWSMDSSVGGLKRTQPLFTTGGVGRFDVHPEIAVPFSFEGVHVRAAVGVRETVYTKSRQTNGVAQGAMAESSSSLNRTDVEAEVDIRGPVLERTFDSPLLERVFGSEVKHTIEPSATYRFVGGINDFSHILRFDDVDVASNTNDLEYGVTQRLFLHPKKPRPCKLAEMADSTDADDAPDDEPNGKPAPPKCSTREFFSWRVGQKAFFNQSFGGALQNGRRNILDTTLNFSGIAFLTGPRSVSPVISRLRVRPNEVFDLEWNFDYDTVQGRFTSNNVFADAHRGNLFGGFSYAKLNAPGRFETDGLPSATTDFNQLRVLLGYGMPTKEGLSVAANAGIDAKLGSLQYGSLETSYNWNCCGLSVEYRKYELGSVRNENAYRFNFTLANIGTAGNLRRAERLF